MNNRGKRWLQEDLINLIEMLYEGQQWNQIAFTLGRSVYACKARYGMIRFAGRMIGVSVSYSDKVIYKPIREPINATNGQDIL